MRPHEARLMAAHRPAKGVLGGWLRRMALPAAGGGSRLLAPGRKALHFRLISISKCFS